MVNRDGPATAVTSCVAWTNRLSQASAEGADLSVLLGSHGTPPADRELLALAAVAVGAAQRALVLARTRAQDRTVSGRPLIELQSTGHRLARTAAELAVARASLYEAAKDEDSGTGAGHHAPAVTAAAAEVAFAASYALVQVYGAAGTSDPAATAAFEACQVAGSAAGPVAALWVRAGLRRWREEE